MSKDESLNTKQHNCPEVVCEEGEDGTRTLGAEEEHRGVAKARSLLIVTHVSKVET